MHPEKLPFALHCIIETAAGLTFYLKPEKQLPNCTPEAKLILRQYGILLLVSSLICLAILRDPVFNSTTQYIALCLALYHVGCLHRAWTRMQKTNTESLLGGPVVHLVVHLVCFALFVYTGTLGVWPARETVLELVWATAFPTFKIYEIAKTL